MKVITVRRWEVVLAFAAVVVAFVVQGVLLKHLSDSRVIDRKRADYRGCVFVREHVVKPDRASVLLGPYSSVPILRKLGFDNAQIEAYLRSQYGGVDPKLLEDEKPQGLGLSRQRAAVLTRGPADGVANELKRRPIPRCVNPG